MMELFYPLFLALNVRKMWMLNNRNRKKPLLLSIRLVATIFILTIIFVSTCTLVSASTTGNATTTTPSLGLEFSAQPIWDETVRTTAIIPINQTHSMATFEGNGTMRVPDTGEIINMTNNGTAFGSIVPQANNTVISYGRENIFSVDDGDTSAITFFEIIQYDPTTFQGKGIVGAVFDNNATGSLAPFNGMMVVGTHEESPATQEVIIRLWEWESGISSPTGTTATTTMEVPPQMNTTNTMTTTNTTTAGE
ncbi:MAG: hypothetical protein M3288_06355 [Thermoproteota archaeon]|nr:hypothetical protein [Thermoproteota archaeon]